MGLGHKTIMKKILIIVVTSWTLLSNAQTNQNYTFSLDEAISYALQHNYYVLNATNDTKIAEQKRWETTTIGLPQINAGLDYQNNIELQKSLIPAEFFGGNSGEFLEVAFGTKHNMVARASISQLIFDGSYLVGLQAAKTYLEISQNAKIKTEAEVKTQVINAYTTVLLADESLKIVQKNKASVQKMLTETQEIYKNGLTEEENVEQLTINLAALANAEKNLSRNREIALKFVKYLVGINIDDSLQLSENLESILLKNNQLAINSFTVTENIDYKIAKNVQRSKELLLKLEKSKALPSLGAALNVGYNGFSDTFTFLEKDQRWLNYSSVGVSLNVPIFSSLGRTARTKQAKIALEEAKIWLNETEQRLQLDYQKAKSDYDFSLENLDTQKQNLALAERIENKNQLKFKEGIATSFELTQAQTQLYTAQQNYLQVIVDVITKKVLLEKML